MKLTVIVPVYNVEKYLEQCITSLLSQTEAFDEILLINDGSTDNSGKICEKYVCRCPQMVLINQENAGLGEARNTGLRRAGGEYVIFVDSDDYVRAEACEAIKKALEIREVDVLFYNADVQYDIVFAERKNSFCHMEALNGQYLNGMEYLKRVYPARHTSSACVAAYRRSFLESYRIQFPKGIYFEDHLFSLQVMSNAKIVSGIPEFLYVRRCRDNSIMTGAMTEKKCRDLVANQKITWNYIAKHPEWTDKKELLRRMISFGVIHTFFELSQYEESCRQEICGKTTEDREFIVALKQELVELFLQTWIGLFQEEQQDLGTSLAFLLILKEDRRNRESDKMVRLIENQAKTLLRKKISALPLDRKGEKVGIYGLGKHTQILLRLYRQEVGEIPSDLFYIVSTEAEKQEKEQSGESIQRKIFLCKDIPEDTAHILISSMGYQQEMYENLQRQGIDEEKICRLYTDHSVCDLILAAWALDYETHEKGKTMDTKSGKV